MNRYVVIGAVGLLAVCVAIGWVFWLNGEADNAVGTPQAGSKAPPLPNQTARGSGIPVPAPPPVARFRPGERSEAPAGQTESQSAVKPVFDVVRINPDGDAVIAGRAAPGAKVHIFDGGKEIGSVTADPRGEWVFLPTEPLPEGERELALSADNPDGTMAESDNVVVLAVPKRGAGGTAVAAAKGKGGGPAASESGKLSGALAVLVPKDGKGPSRVLQKPSEPDGVRKGDLSIGTVDYDDAGNVSIGGQAKAGEEVQVYLDNKLVGRGKTTAEGNWRVEPDDKVSPGMYQLRADSVSSGKVTARIEIPFARAEKVKGLEGEALVIVQPGNSLWRIARRTLGSGYQFTLIYDANKAQILDPDLIYPGQVFALPRTN